MLVSDYLDYFNNDNTLKKLFAQSTFEVSMPKNKVINIKLILNKLFQHFPFMVKILNQIV